MPSPANPSPTTVVGLDACPAGWVGIVLRDGTAPAGVFGATLQEIAAQVPDAAGFGVDIPIGLPTQGERHADVAARHALGARRSSLLMTPVRQALLADTHATATQLSRQLTGKGISRQAYALAPKILEAELWVGALDVPVWEVHPELSFTALLGHPAQASKKTWSGMRERLDALQAAGIELGGLPGAGDRAMADDVIDAAIVAWSTRRIIGGQGVPYPDPPEPDGRTGRTVAIWA
jgi:predicted RNase H-like nuclease